MVTGDRVRAFPDIIDQVKQDANSLVPYKLVVTLRRAELDINARKRLRQLENSPQKRQVR